jgi:hypothetical protein
MLIALKLTLTPLVMALASLASRRWGDAIGGWLTGLPIISAPVSIFLALEHGRHFAALAAMGSIAGVVGQSAFCIGYGLFARRGWPAAIAAAALGYICAASLMIAIDAPLLVLMGIAAVALVVARPFVPAAESLPHLLPAPRWDIPLRMTVATVLVLTVTALAGALGPRISGVSASFPAISGGLAVFAHAARGAPAGVSALRGMASALFGFIAFFGALSVSLDAIAAPFAYLAATLAALGVQGLTLQLIRRDARRVSARAV